MADDPKKPQGLNGPINAHTGQPSPAWQTILAGAAAGMAGQPNPYLAQMQAQHAQQAQALQNAKASQAQQLANYQNTAQAHMQDPAVQQAAIQQAGAQAPAPHPGPAAGGLAGNPLAPNAAHQMQQMGGQAAQQLTPEQQQQLAMSDERLKTDVDRAGIDRQFRLLFDSIAPASQKRVPATGLDSLAARALRRG